MNLHFSKTKVTNQDRHHTSSIDIKPEKYFRQKIKIRESFIKLYPKKELKYVSIIFLISKIRYRYLYLPMLRPIMKWRKIELSVITQKQKMFARLLLLLVSRKSYRRFLFHFSKLCTVKDVPYKNIEFAWM